MAEKTEEALKQCEQDQDATENADMPSAKKEPLEGISRRTMCLGIGGTLGLFALGGLGVLSDKPVVRPPGGQDDDRLLGACIRCGKCMEVCPHHVIRPSHIENGFIGMRTPTMEFSEKWCDWCESANNGVPLCAEVCPTDALQLKEGATAENTILGRAVINMDYCLAYRMINCRFCYDACPYEAMGLDEYNRPYVLNDVCNGCGACQSVCVSLQSGSIAHGANVRAILIEPVTA